MLNIQTHANKALPVMAEIARRTIPVTLATAAAMPLLFLIGGLGSMESLKKLYQDIKKMELLAITAFFAPPAMATMGVVTSYLASPLVGKKGAALLSTCAVCAAFGQFLEVKLTGSWKPVIHFNAVYFTGAAVIISRNHEAIAAYLAK